MKRLTFKQWLAKEKDINSVEDVKSEDFGKFNSEYIDYVAEFIGDVAEAKALKEKESIEKMQKDLKNLEGESKAQKETIKAQNIKIEKGAGSNDPEAKRLKAIKEFRDSVVEGARKVMKGLGEDAFIGKALTNRASVTDNPFALEIPEIGQIATRATSFLDFLGANGRLFNVPQDVNGEVRYIDWDKATIVRAAKMMAEGEEFAESTAKWKTYTESLKKVGDMIPWTDEFEYDDNFLVNELSQFLMTNVKLIKGDDIINGDGVTVETTGIVSLAPTYTPVASGISDASIYDLVVVLRAAITKDAGAKYSMNFALMNITDINKMKLKKDANENYIMPPFVDREGNKVDGATVIEDNNVTANTMIVGDINYTRLYQQTGVGIEKGYINDDFSKGQKRARLYERLLFLIREVDKSGFLKVTDIDAALVTLAS